MDTQSIKARFGIIGNAPALNHALDVAAQVAATDLTVLITGESGVGKEAFSSIIHALSARKHNPFIAVNCGAIPEGTIDSELFGHEKGSFTGAVDARKGYFETVNGGTIFLDEIGEMPLGTQARLLRVLETGEFIRVGSSKVQRTDVRVIAATNRELLEYTAQKKFREDLYYRLSTVPIRVPALRDRPDDIPLLFRKFAGDFAERYRTTTVQLDEGAQQILKTYPWPGNVRELKNIAEQVSVLSTDKNITAEALRRILPHRDPALAHNAASPSMLPAISTMSTTAAGQEFTANERDILHKLFFELRRDMHDIKALLFEMGGGGMRGFSPASPVAADGGIATTPMVGGGDNGVTAIQPYGVMPQPIVLQPGTTGVSAAAVDQHVEVEESLSLTDREREFINKALKKHRGRRRDAAAELGISERTLYRKIKEYGIKE
jgi:DNA-binding NtrC family response regulator